MLGSFSEPLKMILTLVPDVGADGQDGVTESAGPRLVIDVAVSGRQETGALGAAELALSGTHVHTAVNPVRLSKLQGCASLEFEDVLASVEEVRFAFPERCVEGVSSLLHRERRWLRPGLVQTGGWKSCRPPHGRWARRHRLR